MKLEKFKFEKLDTDQLKVVTGGTPIASNSNNGVTSSAGSDFDAFAGDPDKSVEWG